MAAAEELSVGIVGGGDGVVGGGDGVVSGSEGVVSGGEGGVKESEVITSVLEGGRRDEGECNEGCGVALKSILEAIEDLKRCFVSEVNELKSVVKKQEIEIRSLKCGGGGPSGVSGGAHARDVPGGVTEGDVPEATTKGGVPNKSPGNGGWKVVDHGGARPKERKINNDHVVCTNSFQVLSGLQEEYKEVKGQKVDDTSLPEGKILVIGDSQIRHLDSRFCDRDGMHMKSIVECMADQEKKPIVCLSAGGNDVECVRSEELLRRFKEAVGNVRDRGGFPVVCGVLPRLFVDDMWYSRAIAVNCRLAFHCKANSWAFVDSWDLFFRHNHLYHRDGVHLSRKGVQILSESLEREVDALQAFLRQRTGV
ncbi:hypothetical protein GWK47_016881 [Chionoecetes opilio]|uniref:SGNH hydrolase-type esterase domain-containing protein n=1 Tax=Chionoecetes opilio TaxID=41210 RepID=A0A8J4XU77_CHIOP|nr:hypothetical protein GWK47_016881 [Chionoecetes opilio]